MYGDVDTHQQSVLPQAQSYVHRYGPGMILYFFGHAPISLLLASKNNKSNNHHGSSAGFVDDNADAAKSEDIVIMGWELPDTFLWPTGEIGHGPIKYRHPKTMM
jgi:hypothetical protein